jgi:hypothetical protein
MKGDKEMGKRLIPAIFLLLAAGGQAAAERFDDKVRDIFFSGFAGVTKDLDNGMAICAAALRENPNDAEALVWHGAGTFFLSGQAFRDGNLGEGLRLQRLGLAEMDRAVDLDPTARTRAARGPALMGAARFAPPEESAKWLDKAMSDFGFLDSRDRSREGLSEHDRGEVLGALAEGWDRLGDKAKSRAYLDRIAVELPPQSDYAKRAKDWLASGQRPDRMTCLSCHKQAAR